MRRLCRFVSWSYSHYHLPPVGKGSPSCASWGLSSAQREHKPGCELPANDRSFSMRKSKVDVSRPLAFDPGIGLSANNSAPCNAVDESRPGKGERPINSLTGHWCGDGERICCVGVANNVRETIGKQNCRQDSSGHSAGSAVPQGRRALSRSVTNMLIAALRQQRSLPRR